MALFYSSEGKKDRKINPYFCGLLQLKKVTKDDNIIFFAMHVYLCCSIYFYLCVPSVGTIMFSLLSPTFFWCVLFSYLYVIFFLRKFVIFAAFLSNVAQCLSSFIIDEVLSIFVIERGFLKLFFG